MLSDTAAVEDDAAASPDTGRSRTKRTLITSARTIFAVAVVVAVVYATARQWAEVRGYLGDLSTTSVGLALVLVLAGMIAATMGFRVALRSVGHDVPVRTASQIYLIGLLAKYLPGSVWVFVMQAELGKRINIPRSRPFIASLVLTGLSTTMTLVLGLLGFPALFGTYRPLAIALVVLIPIALVMAHPRVLTRIVNQIMRIIRRPVLEQPFEWREVLTMCGWCSLALICFGAHLWMLARGGGIAGLVGFAACVAAIALGLTGGMLAFLSPSGLGAREAVIVAVLVPSVPPGVALGMALVSRMVFTVADLIAAGGAAAAGVKVARGV